MIVTSSSSAGVHRKLLVTLANQHRLPAVYASPEYVAEGGLCAYGVDLNDNYRRAAAYVDRILKGQKPADIPVQRPTKFELVLNLRTARAIGLKIPQAVLVRADKVIE
jgi:putative tryptophan/tyrosine transport system substrate-binding protein